MTGMYTLLVDGLEVKKDLQFVEGLKLLQNAFEYGSSVATLVRQ
jgi:hypothetical protein